MLQAKNITKSIGGRKILHDISLELGAGKIVCIIGPSGAGKTSLLRALSLVDLPDKGSLVIGSNRYQFPFRDRNFASPYPELTVVFQQLFIWPHLTVRENILLPLKGAGDEAYFSELINLFQMEEFLDRHPNEISIGQRQRAVLVRALMLKPRYLLLDEVTSALDIEQSHMILKHLKQIAQRGVGVIFITHALHLATKISDLVVFMEKGEVIETGSGEILTNPKTDRLKKFVDTFQSVI